MTQGRNFSLFIFYQIFQIQQMEINTSAPALYHIWTLLGEQQLYFFCASQPAGQAHQKSPPQIYTTFYKKSAMTFFSISHASPISIFTLVKH